MGVDEGGDEDGEALVVVVAAAGVSVRSGMVVAGEVSVVATCMVLVGVAG